MRWREGVARLVLLVIVIGMPAAIVGYQWVRSQSSSVRVIEISASIPENGGFQPDSITVQENETVTLRFKANDVTHGVAIGPALGIDLGDIDPGYVKEVTLTFDKAGTYTFYCNTWCSPKHWRMRGIVRVIPRDGISPTPQPDPVIDALVAEGINIDAVHEATAEGDDHSSDGHDTDLAISQRTAIERGAQLISTISVPTQLNDPAWRRSHTPAEALHLLSHDNPSTAETDLVDVVVYLWSTTPVASTTSKFDAAVYYAKNCTACHGETGDGKGPAHTTTAEEPVNFSDPSHMFTMRDDVLYAKIRRGGMGTDMPNFGTLITPEETWALVTYLRKFSTAP